MAEYDVSPSSQLNPSQENVLAQLGAKPSERPQFSTGLKNTLKGRLEEVAQNLLENISNELTQLDILKKEKHHL